MALDYLDNVIMGGWQFSKGHTQRDLEGVHVLESYYEAGFRVFDCADIYTGVEELIGAFIAGHGIGADDIYVHTKYVPDLAALPGLSRDQTEAIVDRSRERLGLDTLDLVQFHWWDYEVPGYLDALETLVDLQSCGKIARIGLTNFDAAHVEEILDAGIPVASVQSQFSVLDRRPRGELTELARRHGVSLLSYGSIAGGLLSDRSVGAPPPSPPYDNRSLNKYMLIIEEIGGWQALQEVVQVLKDVADETDADVATVAAAWPLRQEPVDAVIVGVRNTSHLAEHRALRRGVPLTGEQLDRIERVRNRFGDVPGAVFELERDVGGPHNRIMKFDLNAMSR